jgi:hypothetical protein
VKTIQKVPAADGGSPTRPAKSRLSPSSTPDVQLWLNWEIFQFAAINPLFPGDISLEKTEEVACVFPDLIKRLSFDDWKRHIAPIFKLDDVQTQAIYIILTIFLTRDPDKALTQVQAYLANPTCLHCFMMHVTDVVCLVFVKKQFKHVDQRSSFEAFPKSGA